MLSIFRAFPFLWLALSSLTLGRAPAKPLWYVQLLVTEWPLALTAIGFLFWFLLSRRGSWTGHAAFLLAQALLLAPGVRAYERSKTLPAELARAFAHAVPPDERAFAWMPSKPAVEAEKLDTLTFSSGGQMLSIDYWRPKGSKEILPLVLIVHSGSWQSGRRDELGAFQGRVASRGYAVASTDYRFAPSHPFPAARQDVLAAVAFLRGRWKELGFDPAKIVLLGRSAGGQIAVSAAYAAGDPGIKGVVSFYGPMDLMWAYANPSNPLIMDSQKVLSDYLGGAPRENPGVYESASPVLHIGPRTPATLLVHGGIDSLVWPHHSRKMKQALTKAGRAHFYLELPWATHACEAHVDGPSGQLMMYTLDYFLRGVL